MKIQYNLGKYFLFLVMMINLIESNSVLSSQSNKEDNSQLSLSIQKKMITDKEFLTFLEQEEFSVNNPQQSDIQKDLSGFLDRFLDHLKPDLFRKKTVKGLKQFDVLKEDLILICEKFLTTYTQQLQKTKIKFTDVDVVPHISLEDINHQRVKLEPHYLYMQELIDQFVNIKTMLFSEFKVNLERQTKQPLLIASDGKIDISIFKDVQGFNPIKIYKSEPFSFQSIYYGKLVKPARMFGYHMGELVLDSGICIYRMPTSIKMIFYNGLYSSSPFTSSRKSAHLIGNSKRVDLLNEILKQGQNDTNFIPVPTTESEMNLFNLLFLEDLIATPEIPALESPKLLELEDNKDQSSNANMLSISSPIDSSQTNLIKSNEVISVLTDDMTSFLQQIKSEAESAFNQSFEQTTSTVTKNQLKEKVESTPQHKKKTKTRGKAFKGGKGRVKNNSNNNNSQQSSSSENAQKSQQEQATRLKEQLKQEGRIKYRNLLKLLNQAYKNASSEKLENLKKSFTNGSHNSLHLEEGKGLTIVRKHGTGDLTLSAKAANKLIEGIIDMLFSPEQNED